MECVCCRLYDLAWNKVKVGGVLLTLLFDVLSLARFCTLSNSLGEEGHKLGIAMKRLDEVTLEKLKLRTCHG